MEFRRPSRNLNEVFFCRNLILKMSLNRAYLNAHKWMAFIFQRIIFARQGKKENDFREGVAQAAGL